MFILQKMRAMSLTPATRRRSEPAVEGGVRATASRSDLRIYQRIERDSRRSATCRANNDGRRHRRHQSHAKRADTASEYQRPFVTGPGGLDKHQRARPPLINSANSPPRMTDCYQA